MRRMKRQTAEQTEVEGELGALLSNPRVLEMKNYIQHGSVSTFDHCMEVARMSLWVCHRMHLRVNVRALVVGAFLHDFYLYDWHITKHKGTLHGYAHPRVASENARRLLRQPPEVIRIIRSHMWPLTLRDAPTSREGWIVCAVDKIISIKETLAMRTPRSANR